jgi:hypothetical protein
VSSLDKGLVVNQDGSVDVYFGPKAPVGMEKNWIQTIPGKGWNMLFRLYGPLEPGSTRPGNSARSRFGGFSDVELVFDGATVSIFSKGLNAYAQEEMNGTVDELLEALRMGHAVALPAGDFIMSHPYEALIDDVLEAKYLGPGVIDGVRCDHLAFRNFDTDWQVWIEAGDQPLLRKVVITSKTLAGGPQYTLRIKQWDTSAQPTADDFAFVIPDGASELGPDDFLKLDELPEGAPAK